MKRDLGQIDAPLLIFGGPYSNLEATEALLGEARALAIPPERIICTGDLVAMGADPQATVDLIRDSGIAVVMGNCEESLGFGGDDCGCGFNDGSACSLISVQWFRYANDHVDEAAREWMRALPRRIDVRMEGRSLAVIHGAVSSINGFLFASSADQDIAREIDLAGTDGVIGGHCGLPFTRIVGGRLWHNAGVIGVPANDGTPRVWYSLLQPDSGAIRIAHRVLDYDYREAAGKMLARGLPQGYADALASGLWPSCEYLPEAARARPAEPLNPRCTLWREPVSASGAASLRA